jgi:hypothetical protein
MAQALLRVGVGARLVVELGEEEIAGPIWIVSALRPRMRSAMPRLAICHATELRLAP